MTATKTKKTNEAFFNDYADIKSRLAEPIPPASISSKTIQKHHIEYVNVTVMKDLLDERAGVWEALVMDTRQVGENLCCVVRVSIHAADGIFSQDGTGIEELVVSGYGDAFSNAYAQAFRRACESHGLGRELWRKKESRDATGGGSTGSRQQPTKGCTGGPKATPALLETLRRKVDAAGIDGAAFVKSAFPDCGAVEDLTTAAVSFLLVELNQGRY